MTLTVYHDKDKKTSQVIHMSDKAFEKNEKSRKSAQEMNEMCHDIAHDVSRGNYDSILISE